MLIGSSGEGKTTLMQALHQEEQAYKKTQVIEVQRRIIDTPGEYLENISYHRAFLVTAADADVVVLVQSCKNEMSLYPAQFATMFTGKDVIGVVTKTDLCCSPKEIEKIEQNLLDAGASQVFHVSSTDKIGINELKAYLEID